MKLVLTILSSILFLYGCVAAQKSGCGIREVRFVSGTTKAVFTGQLEPCERREFRFRAKAGQKVRATLTPDVGDLIFFIEGTKFLPAPRGSFILEGFNNFGVNDWTGTLPNTDTYKLSISPPKVSNRLARRKLSYRLKIELI